MMTPANSPIALPQASMAPLYMCRRLKGSETVRNMVKVPAPSVRATFSRWTGTFSNPSRMLLM